MCGGLNGRHDFNHRCCRCFSLLSLEFSKSKQSSSITRWEFLSIITWKLKWRVFYFKTYIEQINRLSDSECTCTLLPSARGSSVSLFSNVAGAKLSAVQGQAAKQIVDFILYSLLSSAAPLTSGPFSLALLSTISHRLLVFNSSIYICLFFFTSVTHTLTPFLSRLDTKQICCVGKETWDGQRKKERIKKGKEEQREMFALCSVF